MRIFILGIILLVSSCRHESTFEKIDRIRNACKKMNLSFFKGWEIAAADRYSGMIFSNITNNRVTFSFLAYKENSKIWIKRISPFYSKSPEYIEDLNAKNSPLNSKVVVKNFFELNLDQLSYSDDLNALIISQKDLTLAYLFTPFDNIKIEEAQSHGYKKIDEHWLYFSK